MAGTHLGPGDPEQAAQAVLGRLPVSPEGLYVITSHAGCLVCTP
jgi:hypothetical protein